MNNKKKKVLIVGASAKEYALAKYFSKSANIEKVYIAPGNIASEEFAQRLDIRENDVAELLAFAIKNEIDLTIASSTEAIKADIANDFKTNSQLIFAPEADCADIATSRSTAKKFLYKLHIPTPKFGIFEKQQLAYDYLKNTKNPILITSDFDDENSVRAVCANINQAKSCINDIFFQVPDGKVVLEDYLPGHSFTFYIITDGYQTLPFGVVGDYKFRENGDGGLYTHGMGAYVPDYKVSFECINFMMNNIAFPITQSYKFKNKPYAGILGIECVLSPDNTISVTGLVPFLKEHDAQAVINSIDIDLYSLFEACANGSFADDYEDIPIKDSSNVACVLYSRKSGSVVTGLELVDESTDVGHFATKKNEFFEVLTNEGRTLVLTQTAGTMSRARELLYDNVEDIYFDGIKFRRDICAE